MVVIAMLIDVPKHLSQEALFAQIAVRDEKKGPMGPFFHSVDVFSSGNLSAIYCHSQHAYSQ